MRKEIERTRNVRIPFTNYDIRISKRGAKFLKNGNLVGFADWSNNQFTVANTPIIEELYSTIANQFAKTDFRHSCTDKEGNYRWVNDNLDFIVNERPNPYQTRFDFLFTMAYQMFKFGNALAFITRDEKGYVTEINPINVEQIMFGNGYQIDKDTLLLKYKDVKTGNILLVDYRNVIHLRLNPNNIFYGDLGIGVNNSRTIIDLVDASLGSAINELKENGTIRGVVNIGSAAQGFAGTAYANKAMTTKEAKIQAQKEVVERIKATKGGILVLDAGETWQSLANPFNTASTVNIDNYIDLLVEFNGVNKKVVRGTATAAEMEVFYNKTITPRIEQYVSELNYKVFTKTRLTQGHRIEFYRNPFEYVPITEAINMAYKGAMDTTVNERRRMIYKLPPLEDGDIPMFNKNFGVIGSNYGTSQDHDGLGSLKYDGKKDYTTVDEEGNKDYE